MEHRKWILLFFSLFLLSCNTEKTVTYFIKDSYSGPCVIFQYTVDDFDTNDSLSVRLINGLAKRSVVQSGEKMFFRSSESDHLLQVIPIGDAHLLSETERCILGLSKGLKQTDCLNERIRTISFFVGNKLAYQDWSKKYYSELDYFDSIGTNWCSYYIKGL